MTITPYRQLFYNGCLIACFLMLLEETGDEKKRNELERALYNEGGVRDKSFYSIHVPVVVSKHFNVPLSLYVDNKYFTKKLADDASSSVTVSHNKITSLLVSRLLESGPAVVLIDLHTLGDYSHAPHYIVVTKKSETQFEYVDPMTAKKGRMSYTTLDASIDLLRKHIKICPLVMQVSQRS